ncbi:hypothetical protein PGT21_012295 [Puccinia graminis f. sp. tritici]|uniref:Sepiapterin reductase n=1 Tax=Puccinia graminis f. sp. tritici TaxID=56615 RepID=A0A5B0LR73_PUCGR|nr:hypothetical protein PGTUg99_016092 [Puccinia graminis f. sp. tritici]KAA1083947.1 hypothetical protein PGT21_012295 [Puccinia graminis f. sp. tritici]
MAGGFRGQLFRLDFNAQTFLGPSPGFQREGSLHQFDCFCVGRFISGQLLSSILPRIIANFESLNWLIYWTCFINLDGASKAALNSLCRTLAAEEPEITSVSLRPGVTDTEMQEELRSKGKGLMTPEVYQSCYDLFASSQIVQPDQPAEVIANLAVRADQNLTGQFYAWDDEELKSYRRSC